MLWIKLHFSISEERLLFPHECQPSAAMVSHISHLTFLSGQNRSHVCAQTSWLVCLYCWSQWSESFSTVGHSCLSAWFSVGVRKIFGLQIGKDIFVWRPARLSIRASLWRCIVCLLLSLCVYDGIVSIQDYWHLITGLKMGFCQKVIINWWSILLKYLN